MRRIGLALLLALSLPVQAWAWTTDPATPEGWAWARIKLGQLANFDDHCGKTLDPRKPDGWDDACRQVSAQFIEDVLTLPQWKQQVPRRGMRLHGAHIANEIDLADGDIDSEVWLDASRIDGELDLSDAHLKHLLSLDGSTVNGRLLAYRMVADSDFTWQDHATFGDDVIMIGATLSSLEVDTASFAKQFNVNSITVRGSLFMGRGASFGGDVDLIRSQIGGNLEMNGGAFMKLVNVDSATVRGNVFIRDHARFAGDLVLRGGVIDGNLEISGATFAAGLNANSMSVHGALFMSDHSTFAGPVNLIKTDVGGNVEMSTAAFAKELSANSMTVHGSVFMRDHASFGGDVDLGTVGIGGNLEMQTSSFAQALNADSADIHGTLLMRDGATFGGDVTLRLAKVGRNIEMDSARFAGNLNADRLSVDGAMFIRDHATFAGDMILTAAHVGWLDLSSAVASTIDMSDLEGATGGELQLNGLTWRCRPEPGKLDSDNKPRGWALGDSAWRTASCPGGDASLPRLVLRNAHVEALQDGAESWPPILDLEGFRYDRLGGVNGDGRADMRKRLPDAWTDWLARDRTFSPQPYNQLASVLMGAGRRDIGEDILFAGRERERDEVWNRPATSSWQWLRGDFLAWLWLRIFAAVAGYGIGLYTFRVLWWVVGLTVLGAVVLCFSPYARARSVGWRIGASLHRLLPVVELSKEFKDFFDNTTEPGTALKLHRWQVAFFAGMALAGWVLGFFLLAAMGGLTQK